MLKDYLVLNEANDIIIGPFIDSTDGKTLKPDLVFIASDIKVLLPKASDFTSILISESLIQVDLANGYYKFSFIDTNFISIGRVEFFINKAGALPVKRICEIKKQWVIMMHVEGGTITANTNPEVTTDHEANVKVFDGEGVCFDTFGTAPESPAPGLVKLDEQALDISSVLGTGEPPAGQVWHYYFAISRVCRHYHLAIAYGEGP
jgi:hypothetical protein